MNTIPVREGIFNDPDNRKPIPPEMIDPACWCSDHRAAFMKRKHNSGYLVVVMAEGKEPVLGIHASRSTTPNTPPVSLPYAMKPISQAYIELVDEIHESDPSDWAPLGTPRSPLQVLAEQCDPDDQLEFTPLERLGALEGLQIPGVDSDE